MPDETTTVDTTQAVLNPFDDANWSDTPISPQQQKEPEIKDSKTVTVPENKPIATPDVTPKPEEKEEIIDASEWLKKEFQVEDINIIKQERDELRKLKDAKPQEIKFANDESERLYNSLLSGDKKIVFDILKKQNEISEIETYDLANLNNAEEVIRLALKYKYPELTNTEISDVYNEQYSKPQKPDKAEYEEEADYKQAVENWQQKCDLIDKKIVRDAKISKPELVKLKSELVFPEIKKEVQQDNKPSPEDLDNAKKYKENFVKSSEDSIKDLNGFSVSVKDKDVDYSVSYDLSNEEKNEISKRVSSFLESGYDANALFYDRWVNDDGTINTKKMVEDLSRMFYGEKASEKFASDAANKRLEIYLKEKKNIKDDTSSNGVGLTAEGEKTDQTKMAEHFFNN
jgi:hypothetical protein